LNLFLNCSMPKLKSVENNVALFPHPLSSPEIKAIKYSIAPLNETDADVPPRQSLFEILPLFANLKYLSLGESVPEDMNHVPNLYTMGGSVSRLRLGTLERLDLCVVADAYEAGLTASHLLKSLNFQEIPRLSTLSITADMLGTVAEIRHLLGVVADGIRTRFTSLRTLKLTFLSPTEFNLQELVSYIPLTSNLSEFHLECAEVQMEPLSLPEGCPLNFIRMTDCALYPLKVDAMNRWLDNIPEGLKVLLEI